MSSDSPRGEAREAGGAWTPGRQQLESGRAPHREPARKWKQGRVWGVAAAEPES